MNWFRMYHEARTDAKLNALTDSQFRVWFRLLCFASEQQPRGTIPPISPSLLAIEVSKGNQKVLQETLERLSSLHIIQQDGNGTTFINWAKRQFQSDSSTDRVRTYRSAKRVGNVTETLRNGDETLLKHHVTAPDTDSDTDKCIKDTPPNGGTPVGVPPVERKVPKPMAATMAYFLAETKRPADSVTQEERAAVYEMNRTQTPGRVNTEIDRALKRYKARGQPVSELTLVYIADSLRNQVTRPEAQQSRAPPINDIRDLIRQREVKQDAPT